MNKIIILILCVLLFASNVYAIIGGVGSTCDPSTVDWGSCELGEPSWVASVTESENISSGNYATPFQADQANTRYTLQGNITADTTAIEVVADYVIIDLGGYSITYNNTSDGGGVEIGAYNIDHFSVINGSIIQGSDECAGDQYGRFCAPISTSNTLDVGQYGGVDTYNYFANLYLTYSGQNVGGIVASGNYATIEQCTLEDTYGFGSITNRHQGVDAIDVSVGGSATGSVIRNNTIIDAKHRGIEPGNNSEVYGNHITLNSIAVNSFAIQHYSAHGNKYYSNTIIGRGEHPIGIGFGSGGYGNEAYNNYFDMQVTHCGTEYDEAECLAGTGEMYLHASAFRSTWGETGSSIHDNEILITTDSDYAGQYSLDGSAVTMDVGGRGIHMGINEGDTLYVYNNTIEVTGDGFDRQGFACSYSFSENLFVYDNEITSTGVNISLGDSYGACNNHPLFARNTLIKSGSEPDYYTFISSYNDTDRNTTGRIIETTYEGGASESSISFKPNDPGLTEVYFGHLEDGIPYYDYLLWDEDNTSSTLEQLDYDPAETMDFSYPDLGGGGSAILLFNQSGNINLNQTGTLNFNQ